MTSASLKYLQKLGSGKKGTIKGFVYASVEMEPGWVVYANGTLLHRKLHAEEGTFCTRIDRNTLQVSPMACYPAHRTQCCRNAGLWGSGAGGRAY